MRELLSFGLVSLSAVFFIVDPFAVVPVYLAITQSETEEQKRATALRAALTSGLTLMVFGAAGQLIFKFFGISLPAFKIAGGLLCFLVALDMMQARPSRTRSTPEEEKESVDKADVAIIPLAIPLLSGPGAIATVMVLMAKTQSPVQSALVFGAIALTTLATWATLRGASWIERKLSRTFLNVLMRVMGLILAAIAVEFVLSGLHEAFPKAHACAALSERGPVTIRGEEALIVWDDATKTEHFIRRAFFKDAPPDFGFLVPTPSKPELAEVPSAVFDRLYALYKEPPPRAPLFSRGVKAAAVATPSNGVLVVEEKQVAGLDATVLLASDEKALSAWLKSHKYPSSPALEAWLAPYVKKGSYVTAFKLAGGAAAMASKSVRMSFRADAPLFPYSEPPGDGQPRPFRLSVVSSTRMEGSLGDRPWKADIGYAAAMSEDDARALLDGVTPRGAQRAGWITTFDEPRSIRGRDDLILKATKNSRVAPHLSTKIEP